MKKSRYTAIDVATLRKVGETEKKAIEANRQKGGAPDPFYIDLLALLQKNADELYEVPVPTGMTPQKFSDNIYNALHKKAGAEWRIKRYRKPDVPNVVFVGAFRKSSPGESDVE